MPANRASMVCDKSPAPCSHLCPRARQHFEPSGRVRRREQKLLKHQKPARINRQFRQWPMCQGQSQAPVTRGCQHCEECFERAKFCVCARSQTSARKASKGFTVTSRPKDHQTKTRKAADTPPCNCRWDVSAWKTGKRQEKQQFLAFFGPQVRDMHAHFD